MKTRFESAPRRTRPHPGSARGPGRRFTPGHQRDRNRQVRAESFHWPSRSPGCSTSRSNRSSSSRRHDNDPHITQRCGSHGSPASLPQHASKPLCPVLGAAFIGTGSAWDTLGSRNCESASRLLPHQKSAGVVRFTGQRRTRTTRIRTSSSTAAACSSTCPPSRAASRTLDETGRRLAGVWRQSGFEMPVSSARPQVRGRPQAPQETSRPLPSTRRDRCAVSNVDVAGISLAGLLTVPRTAGSHPAALLISGSGPQDRNEQLFGHRPFLVIADHLTRHGIAVLRVDDRGVGSSTG